MKRLIPVVVMCGLLVVGCGRSKKTAETPAQDTTPVLTPPPAPEPAPIYTPAPEPTVTSPAPVTQAPTVKETPTKAAPVKTAPVKPAPAKVYVVKRGDTLSEIASANKTTIAKIMALNPEVKKADTIYVGQKLKMP